MLSETDPEVHDIIRREEARQQETLSLIPSENFFSPAVREAVGSVFMHKYSEGNVGQRYYEGNQYVDALECLALARARQLFRLPPDWEANVQALSGSNANVAVYLALLDPGDVVLSMYLPDGGHLSHGWSYDPGVRPDPAELVALPGRRRVTVSSRLYRTVQYKTDPSTRLINYDALATIAQQHRPRLIITGGTAYPRLIDHRRIRAIADGVGAWYLADIAHEAGLVAAGNIPSPVGVASVVTMTTHKTLRAGRGAIILAPAELMRQINRAVMPGLQGGPHNHNIAGICVGLGEALRPEFRVYAQQVVANARHLAAQLSTRGFRLVAGGTDKHLLLIDLTGQPLLGRQFARALDCAGLVTNFNTMPQEVRPPTDPSALRLGTPWVTTRGMREREMEQIAAWLFDVLAIGAPWGVLPRDEFDRQARSSLALREIRQSVRELAQQFLLPVAAPEAERQRMPTRRLASSDIY
ncbi:MAG: serine hydroxymethyltransferase [Candidatus Andersenbacteria bacterium]|nr:serine hydroxymethyltransferase [Candidatus Andersenbacteria bacterium]